MITQGLDKDMEEQGKYIQKFQHWYFFICLDNSFYVVKEVHLMEVTIGSFREIVLQV